MRFGIVVERIGGESAVMLSSLERAQLDGLRCRGHCKAPASEVDPLEGLFKVRNCGCVLEMQKRVAGAACHLSAFRDSLALLTARPAPKEALREAC
jgi:hypothetical protein